MQPGTQAAVASAEASGERHASGTRGARCRRPCPRGDAATAVGRGRARGRPDRRRDRDRAAAGERRPRARGELVAAGRAHPRPGLPARRSRAGRAPGPPPARRAVPRGRDHGPGDGALHSSTTRYATAERCGHPLGRAGRGVLVDVAARRQRPGHPRPPGAAPGGVAGRSLAAGRDGRRRRRHRRPRPARAHRAVAGPVRAEPAGGHRRHGATPSGWRSASPAWPST